MKRRVSIAGSVLVAIYLAVVIYLHLDAEHCAEIDGLFCGFGYMVAGFPWNWILLSLADIFMPEHRPSVEQKFLWGIFFFSVTINSFILYLAGRFIGNVVSRVRSDMKSSGAT